MVVTNEFRPDPRVFKEAKSLRRAGHAVTVLAWDREKSGLPRHESIDEVEVRRVRVPGGRYGSGLTQLAGYILFYVYAIAFLIIHRHRIDILHAHEVDVLPVCAGAKWIIRVPLVVDFHELYSGRQVGLMPRLMGAVERRFLKYADGFLTVNDELASYYSSWLKAGTPVVVLPNYPERGHLPSESDGAKPFTVSFFGNVRNAQEIVTLIEAARRVPGVQVLIAGHGQQVAEVKAYIDKHRHAKYLGPFTYDQQPALYRQSHVVYAVCALDRNMASAYPVKMWEGLICGQPVIVAKNSVAERFVAEHGVGAAVTGTAVDEVVAALEAIRAQYSPMSARARTLGATHNWEHAVKGLFQIYATLHCKSS